MRTDDDAKTIMSLESEIERLQRENEDYLRMLKMSGQNIGLRLLDAEEKVARLESMLDRLARWVPFIKDRWKEGDNKSIAVWWNKEAAARIEYAASHREKEE